MRENSASTKVKHGHIKDGVQSPTYVSWRSMIQRCETVTYRAYPRYGARGISVDPRWRADFSAFLEDMGERPEGATLDRLDVDGHYTKDNCRWSTRPTQDRGTSANRWLTFEGKTLILADWAKEIGISPNSLRMRLATGWTIERALTQKPERHKSPWSADPDTREIRKKRSEFNHRYRHLVRSEVDDLTFEEWLGVIEVHKSCCRYCRTPLRRETLTMDHVTPISLGGRHTVLNVVPACRSCNSAKRNRLERGKK